jgi:hypothetical protein
MRYFIWYGWRLPKNWNVAIHSHFLIVKTLICSFFGIARISMHVREMAKMDIKGG